MHKYCTNKTSFKKHKIILNPNEYNFEIHTNQQYDNALTTKEVSKHKNIFLDVVVYSAIFITTINKKTKNKNPNQLQRPI